MALLRPKYGARLSNAAKRALNGCKSYAPGFAVLNALTREPCLRLANTEWASTIAEIDFDYSMQDETIAGVSCVRYQTPNTQENAPLLLYIHAGAFVAGSGRTNAAAILPACHLSGSEGVCVDYTLAPYATFPTQLEEIERVYLNLCEMQSPKSIVLLGDSAGAGMAVAALMRWRRRAVPLPAGAVLISPLADARPISDTYVTVKSHDPVFNIAGGGGVSAIFKLYAPSGDYSNPEISPLAGDFRGLPPLLIHIGTREVFLGDAARLAEKARCAGVDVALRVFDGMFHLFHMHWSLDEAKSAHEDIAAFVKKTAQPVVPALKRARTG